jgi:multicomponent K+:H+ antiporter subunit C
MEALLAIAVGVLTACGVFLILRARTFPVLLGLTLLSYAVNLFLFASGRLRLDAPPLIRAGASYTDPLPQALVLTAIVIGFGMTAYLAMLALRGLAESGSDHVDARKRAVIAHAPILPILIPFAAALLQMACSDRLAFQRVVGLGRGPAGAAHRLADAARRRRAIAGLRARRLAGTLRHRPGRRSPGSGDDAADRRPRFRLAALRQCRLRRSAAGIFIPCSSCSCWACSAPS